MPGLARHLQTLQTTLVREYTQAPGLFGEIARMEALLADTYRDRVPYELLQNSDDAGSRVVEVEDLGDGRFGWRNDGRPLNAADIEALCRSASSTKQRGEGTIGYRGIGFKSLAAIAERIDIRSADVAFSFDRRRSAEKLGMAVDPGSVPLIRVPTGIREVEAWVDGVSFTVTRQGGAQAQIGNIDPISVLFLRNVEQLTVRADGQASTAHIERNDQGVVLRNTDGEARFALLRHGGATVAVPLDARALALAGIRGRLACFLPLSDELGVPIVVSGDLLTDPSRTHAVVGDESTQQILADAASAVAEALCMPSGAVFERLWELVLDGEDIRSPLVAPTLTASKAFLTFLRDEMMARQPGFAYSPVALEPEDVAAVFPQGGPVALYAERNQASARAARTVLGLRSLDIAEIVNSPAVPGLSAPTRTRLGHHLAQLARTHGRRLSPAEQQLVDAVAEPATPPAAVPKIARTDKAATVPSTSLPEILTRWRTAEVATMEFLNARGWKLRDVSAQNVGYDLEGVDSQGNAVRVEVKKVDQLDAQFSMTNNELSLMLHAPKGYLIALLVGDGPIAKLMILDPANRDLPRERVCRRWDYVFTDWARFATTIS
ncbi:MULTISPECIES: DUF3883 domain-containing protein [Actinomadura]|uniref:DUF3883 domain-containing protein n=1 Tax=Actinomadura yumaensis TaxID=111807 RepID=A0ABW2CLH6_9ACTN|nr:DUF3883 domain-containing protein [Actinomadura sp. J1-007]MWK37188.1 DUF3883 domain-containing protein [Actinomadura sp. J1-007]